MSGPPYIVWSPDGETPPKVSHDNHKAAHFAACTMAKLYPGKQFFVMARTGKGALFAAQVGTHPKGGDAKQAPGDSLSDAVAEGDAP